MFVFSVVGLSKSGKTTTIEKIIKELKRRRYRVGSIKDIHFEDFALDEKGSNTNRHYNAGSELVTAWGLGETDLLFPKRLDIYQILSFYDHDFVVIEGYRDGNFPKIVCGETLADIDNLMDQKTIAIAGKISNSSLEQYQNQPCFNALTEIESFVDYLIAKIPPHYLPDFDKKCCGKCGYSCQELLTKILNNTKSYLDCVLQKPKVEVFFNQKPLKMVPFVQDSIAAIMRGYLSNLDHYQDHQEIIIKIKDFKKPSR